MAKKVLPKFAMFGDAGVDLSQPSVTSSNTNVEFIDNIGIILSWSGSSPSGTFVVQHSDDQQIWDDYDFGTPISITGNSGAHSININQQPFTYIRAIYTGVSGTGTMSVQISGKEV